MPHPRAPEFSASALASFHCKETFRKFLTHTFYKQGRTESIDPPTNSLKEEETDEREWDWSGIRNRIRPVCGIRVDWNHGFDCGRYDTAGVDAHIAGQRHGDFRFEYHSYGNGERCAFRARLISLQRRCGHGSAR